MIDSVFRTGKNYYPQVCLEESKYVVKENKIPKYIIDDIEIYSGSNKKNLILMKKVNFIFHMKIANTYYQKHKERLRKEGP